MEYTVKKLAKLVGISVRTLHYYDEKELVKLQQILFFRELEFPLEKIKQIMESPGFDLLAVLSDQQKLLILKKKGLNG